MRHTAALTLAFLTLLQGVLGMTAGPQVPREEQIAEEQVGVVQASDDEIPSAERIDAKLAEVQALPTDAPSRSALLRAYENTRASLLKIEELRQERRELAERAEKGRTGVSELEAKAAALELAGLGLPEDLGERDTAALDRAVSEAALEADKLQRTAERLQELLRDSAERRLATAKRRSEVELILAAPRGQPESDEGGQLAEANGDAAKAARLRFEEELLTLTEREATFDVRLDLLRGEAAYARIVADQAGSKRELLEEALNAKRAADAISEVKRADEARATARKETLAFAEIAEATLAVREGNVEVARKQQELSDRRQSVEDKIKDFAERLQETRERVKEPSLARANGLRLRGELRDIAKERALDLAAPDVSGDLTQAQVKLSQVGQKLEALRGDQGWIEAVVAAATLDGQMGEEEALELATEMRSEYVAALQDTGDTLGAKIEVLGALSVKRAKLGSLLKEYEAFVIERVLWIQSSEPAWRIRANDLDSELRAALLLGPWTAMKKSLEEGGRVSSSAIASIVALLVLFAVRRRLRRALEEEGELARQRTQVSIGPTLRALVLSALIAAPYGALLYGVGMFLTQLEVDATHASYVLALADGCSRGAIPLWLIGAMRVLVRKDGLAEAHFQWSDDASKLVRRETVWLLAVAPVAAFLAEFLAGLSTSTTNMNDMFAPLGVPTSAGAEGLSRAAFLVDVTACALFAYRVLHPARGILAINVGKMRSGDLLTRLRRLWFVLLMAALMVFGVATILGYGYTARSLFSRLVLSVALLVGIFVARGIALRWIRLELRAEAFEKLRKRREEMRTKREAEIERRRSAGEDVEELESEGLEVEDQEVDVATLSSDVLSLVRIVTGIAAVLGVLGTCASVLPALGVFDRVHLWQEEVVVADAVGLGAGAGTLQPLTTYEWVTLENLGLAGLILLLMWLAIRDIPSLLEFMVLRRLQLGSGERYAITTLLRYLITVVGLGLAFDELGLSWSKLQWLVAGVSVGLGFGLQEIFANFVSGLTLLFERPVRVGDWVTLGEIEGVVSKIRIRATTIRDRDLKELIVPNREFITGRFINWTLSDPVSRVTLSVGVAYGSDTEKAIQLLLEAGRGSVYSVAEPAPNVVFTSFGGSSLDFELRVFVSGREIKPRVVHDLHMRVDAAFREAGIEIAFPQQDVHLRTLPPEGFGAVPSA